MMSLICKWVSSVCTNFSSSEEEKELREIQKLPWKHNSHSQRPIRCQPSLPSPFARCDWLTAYYPPDWGSDSRTDWLAGWRRRDWFNLRGICKSARWVYCGICKLDVILDGTFNLKENESVYFAAQWTFRRILCHQTHAWLIRFSLVVLRSWDHWRSVRVGK